jgi:hypothetical protein
MNCASRDFANVQSQLAVRTLVDRNNAHTEPLTYGVTLAWNYRFLKAMRESRCSPYLRHFGTSAQPSRFGTMRWNLPQATLKLNPLAQ